MWTFCDLGAGQRKVCFKFLEKKKRKVFEKNYQDIFHFGVCDFKNLYYLD